MSELKSYHINQRNEGIDLDNVSGALMATQNMQMQTFVKEPLNQKEKIGFDGYAGDVTGQVAATLGTNCGNSTGRNGVIEPAIYLNDQGGERMDITEDITATLRAGMGGNLPIVMATQQGGAEIAEGVCPTITASAGMSGNNSPVVLRLTSQCDVKGDEGLKTQSLISVKADNLPVLFDNHGKDCRYNGPLKVAPTVASVYGTGGNNIPLLTQPLAFSLDSKDSNSMKSANPISGCRETDKSRTLDTSNPDPSKNQGGVAILQPQESYCIAANTIDRQPQNGGNGQGVQKDIRYTLTTSDIHAIYKPEPYQEVVGALCHRDYKGVNTIYVNQDKCIVDKTYQDVVGALCSGDEKGIGNQYVEQGKCIIDDGPAVFGGTGYADFDEGISTLRASGGTNGGGSENLAVKRNLVRRLTPLECERLQGFPDGWTNIEKAADSPRYKALGNSVAIPCVDFVMRGIAYFLQQIKKEQEESNGISIP
ncbi:DNA cytosine methyltransferase [Oscillibacter ruminantium]|uniref:DNA cytosine methyltransferase n=1 Tax=Oscillibacter ruminantium TaxID=1263547 RepID=UPI003DA184E7